MNLQEQPLECLFRLMRALRRGRSHHHGPHHFHGYGRLMEAIAQYEGTSAREFDRIAGFSSIVSERNAFPAGISGRYSQEAR